MLLADRKKIPSCDKLKKYHKVPASIIKTTMNYVFIIKFAGLKNSTDQEISQELGIKFDKFPLYYLTTILKTYIDSN